MTDEPETTEPEAPTPALSGYQKVIPSISAIVKQSQGEPTLEAVEVDWEVFDSQRGK
jgi:hypothetical protein